MIRNPTTPAGFAYRNAWDAFKDAFMDNAPPAEIDRLGAEFRATRDALWAPVGR